MRVAMELGKKLIQFLLRIFFNTTLLFGGNDSAGKYQRGSVCSSPECQRTSAMIARNMNKGVDKCVDFYEYACSNFKLYNPISPLELYVDQTTTRYNEMKAEIQDFFKRTDLRHYPNIKKIYTIYNQCLDERPYDLSAISLDLKMVNFLILPPFHGDISDSYDAINTLAKMHRYTSLNSFLFNVDVQLNPRNFPANHILFRPTVMCSEAPVKSNDEDGDEFEASNEEIRIALRKRVTKTVMFFYQQFNIQLTKEQEQKIISNTIQVADFLLELDKATGTEEVGKLEDVTYATRTDFQTWTNNILKGSDIQINWKRYFQTLFENIINLNYNENVNTKIIMIQNPDQLKRILNVLRGTSRNVFVRAMWYIVVQSFYFFAPPILQDLSDEYQATVNKINSPELFKNYEERCISLFGSYFSDLSGYILAAKKNSLTDKQQVTKMLTNIKESMKEIIQESIWLDQQTKRIAVQKLNSITSYVSFSDIHLNIDAIEKGYEMVQLGSNYFITQRLLMNGVRAARLSLILTKNVFEEKIPINPFSMMANYYQDFVHINISSGLLGFPFYNLGLDALNYAAVGFHIGHELGHLFDLQGIKRPGNGVFKPWLSPTVGQEYDARAKCFRTFYGKFYFEAVGKNIDGDRTLTENLADSMGFAAALRAYRNQIRKLKKKENRLKGFENLTGEQLFVLTFANIWCENMSPRALKIILNSTYSPHKARVNGVLMNSKEFRKIYGCRVGSPMNPKIKCSIFS